MIEFKLITATDNDGAHASPDDNLESAVTSWLRDNPNINIINTVAYGYGAGFGWGQGATSGEYGEDGDTCEYSGTGVGIGIFYTEASM